MILRIVHQTVYDYAEPALTCQNQVHLTPRDLPRQTCQRSLLTIEPQPRSIERFTDYFGNAVAAFQIDEPHARLSVTVRSRVELHELPALRPGESLPWEQVRSALTSGDSIEALEAYQFVFASPQLPVSSAAGAYAKAALTPGRPLLEAVLDLAQRIRREFKYVPAATTIATPVEEVLTQRRGVCQDFAQVMIAGLRALGVPARYVSGYLRTDPPAGQPRLVGVDASHAWVEVFDPRQGWVGFDPTNGCLAGMGHVVVAWGRDYDDVSPIKGVVLGGGAHTLKVSVDVTPV